MLKRLLVVAALTLPSPAVAQPDGSVMSREAQEQARAAIFAATAAPDFRRYQILLEVYRTLRAAGVTLSSAEALEMGEAARMRGLPIEAVEAYGLLRPDDPEYRRNERLIAAIQVQAQEDRNGGVEKSVEPAKKRASGEPLNYVAQAFAGQGEHERAVELYQLALGRMQMASDKQVASDRQPTAAERAAWASKQAKARGRSVEFYELEAKLNPGVVFGADCYQFSAIDLALAQLNYGISLFRLKRVAEARAVWNEISGNKAVEILADAWIDIANRSTN